MMQTNNTYTAIAPASVPPATAIALGGVTQRTDWHPNVMVPLPPQPVPCYSYPGGSGGQYHHPGAVPPSSVQQPHRYAPQFSAVAQHSSNAAEYVAMQNVMKQRRGKWMPEEEEYAKFLIEEFESGLSPDCKNGCTLRAHLSRRLYCSPMRISKKFAGRKVGMSVFRCKMNATTEHMPELLRNRQRTHDFENSFLKAFLTQEARIRMKKEKAAKSDGSHVPEMYARPVHQTMFPVQTTTSAATPVVPQAHQLAAQMHPMALPHGQILPPQSAAVVMKTLPTPLDTSRQQPDQKHTVSFKNDSRIGHPHAAVVANGAMISIPAQIRNDNGSSDPPDILSGFDRHVARDPNSSAVSGMNVPANPHLFAGGTYHESPYITSKSFDDLHASLGKGISHFDLLDVAMKTPVETAKANVGINLDPIAQFSNGHVLNRHAFGQMIPASQVSQVTRASNPSSNDATEGFRGGNGQVNPVTTAAHHSSNENINNGKYTPGGFTGGNGDSTLMGRANGVTVELDPPIKKDGIASDGIAFMGLLPRSHQAIAPAPSPSDDLCFQQQQPKATVNCSGVLATNQLQGSPLKYLQTQNELSSGPISRNGFGGVFTNETLSAAPGTVFNNFSNANAVQHHKHEDNNPPPAGGGNTQIGFNPSLMGDLFSNFDYGISTHSISTSPQHVVSSSEQSSDSGFESETPPSNASNSRLESSVNYGVPLDIISDMGSV